MDTDSQSPNRFTWLSETAAFLVTVAVCSLLLVAIGSPDKSDATPSVVVHDLATPQPPGMLALLTEPFVFLPEAPVSPPEPLCGIPDIELPPPVARSAENAATALEMLPIDETIPFHGIIVRAAGRYQEDPHLIRAIIFAESGFNPKAKSKKGARGLMQLMPTTAKALGVQDISAPAENIDGGVRYFR